MVNTQEIVIELGQNLERRGAMLTVAESCTGGALSAAITVCPGVSAWFERGFVTYTNAAKMQCLAVAPDVFENNGAVSEECVRQMAIGALENSDADVSIAVSGVAGPSGGSAEKPVGRVWFAIAHQFADEKATTLLAQQMDFNGDRAKVIDQAVEFALRWLLLVAGI